MCAINPTNPMRPKPPVTVFLLISVYFLGVQAAHAQARRGGYFEPHMHQYRGDINPYRPFRYWAVGGGFSLLQYSGDLTRSNLPFGADRPLLRGGINAFAIYKLSPRFSLVGDLMLGQIAGDDNASASLDLPGTEGLYIRNLSFRNSMAGLSFRGRIDFVPNRHSYVRRPRFNAFLSGGIGLLFHSPQGKVPEFGIDGVRFENAGTWVGLRALGTEGQQSPYYSMNPYSPVVFMVPLGGGIELRVNRRTSLVAEVTYHYTFTDYLDDVSGRYVDLGALDGELARAMSDRSREEMAVMTAQLRDMEGILARTQVYTYVSEFDGRTYTVFSGFGHEGAQRGGDSRDSFFSFSVKLAYMLNKSGNYGMH